MNDIESENVYHELVSILHDAGLDWIVDQITAVIREGKTSEVKALTFREKPPDSQTSYLNRMALIPAGQQSFIAATDYSANERVRMLIDAIGVAIIDTADMEQEIIKTLNSADREQTDTLTSRSVEFRPLTDLETKPLRISSDSAAARKESAAKLYKLLTTLREEV
jgi:hypothetical protein